MEGKHLVHLPAIDIQGEPPQQEPLLLIPPSGHRLHGDQGGQLQDPVAVNIAGIDIIIEQGADTGIRLAGEGNIGKLAVLDGENIRDNGVFLRRTGHIYRRDAALQLSGDDPANLGGILGQFRFHGTEDLATLAAVEHRHAPLSFRFSGAQDHQFAAAVSVQVTGHEFGIDVEQQQLRVAVGEGINRHTAKHLIADLLADDQLIAGIFIELHVFHLFKCLAVAADGLHGPHRTIRLLLKDQHLQGLFRGALGKHQVFVHPISVQVRQLHRLLVFAGPGSTVSQAIHGRVNGRLQLVVFF